MSDDNLKLKVKNELKTNMPNKLLLELFKEMNLNTSLGKTEAINSIFQIYTAEEVKDMILKKYEEKGSYSRSKERFLKSLNRKSIEERSKLKKMEEKEKKKRIRQERMRKNKERDEKREKESEEERKLKEKELEEKRREIEKLRIEEAKRIQEQNRKIEEEKKREEERQIEIEKNRKTEQEKREVNKRMKELLQNSSSNLKIYHAKCTDVFFIYDYIKSEVRKDYKKNNIRLSSKMDEIVKIDGKIIGYKYDGFHIEFFSEKLLESIKIISAVYFRDKDGVVLVAVPPSEKGKDPQTKKSIEMIEEWANEEKYEIDFKVYDKSKFLIRTHDVESSKTGNRSIAKHENSIECDKKDNMPSNIGVIILDDVTTSGNTMYVCKNKLIEYGLDEENVIPLAIARTLNPYNEIYDSLEGKYFVYDDNVEELK
ncbi:MAG: hypothetical protein MR277_08990 [Methanobrevibacter ruminantium]|uniref:hypothetical protein n=1 Tax=Methanobrevibacter ruminantium TaxID=83816 RepID=UPI002D7E473D|nr:hypothetical protein [Methanobrevibacter ruminantium]MCI5738125.1 hypothetical protein [Methanobrevibacter ruminantium]